MGFILGEILLAAGGPKTLEETMSDKAWNYTARLMRAGDEFSEANRKLSEAAQGFVKALHERVGDQGFSEGIGWILHRIDETHIRLAFERSHGSWHYVITNAKNSIWEVLELAEALAGPEGKRLTEWLEEKTAERNKVRKVLVSFTGQLG